MPNELMLLRQMLGTDVILQVLFFVGVFLTVLFRRDAIESLYRFRLACLLFVLSLVLPGILQPILQGIYDGTGIGAGSRGGRGRSIKWDAQFFMQLFTTSLGPVLFGTAFMLYITSLLPRSVRERATNAPIVPHPLD